MALEVKSTPSEQNTVDVIRQYLSLILHWVWLIILAAILAGGVAFFISMQITPVYQSESKVLVVGASRKTTDSEYQSVLTSERLARTYADMMTSETVLNEVIKRLKLDIHADALAKDITVTPIRDTQLINITVEGTNPIEIAQIANMIITVFSEKIQVLETSQYSTTQANLQEQITQMNQQIIDLNSRISDPANKDEKANLETQLVQYRQIYTTLLTNYEQARIAEAQNVSNVVQVNLATPQLVPVRPNVLLNTALAALLAMLTTIAIIIALDSMDDAIRSPEDVVNRLGLPVIGVIFTHDEKIGEGPITQMQPRSPTSEAFRKLRTNVQYANVDEPLRIIMVTSPTPVEGKSTVSANLAVVFAQGGKKVTLVDADLRRPTLYKRLGLNNHLGLTHLLVQPLTSLNGHLQETKTEGLSVLTSGDIPPNPSEILGSNKMKEILQEIKKVQDVIVIDTPPVLAVADATVLAPAMDGVLLVIKPGSTAFSAARNAIEQLRQVGANLIGVVLNDLDLKASRYHYYYRNNYYYYHSDYSDSDSHKGKNK